ncbi:MAG: hypothetical protein ACK41O_02945 [Runella zeae]
MNKIRLQELLEKGIISFLKPEGFKFNGNHGNSGSFIKRETNGNYQHFFYSIVDQGQKFQIGVSSSLRLQKIEEIWFEKCFSPEFMSKKSAKDSPTILYMHSWPESNLTTQFDNIYSEIDLEEVLKDIENIFFCHYKPFFNKFSSIESFDNLVNKNPDENLPFIQYNYGTRALKGLISAKLCKNTNYENLKIYYEEKIKLWVRHDTEQVISIYHGLIKYLDSMF